ncbi:Quinolinate synthase A [Poriferisphaera corsica]|uniref:Quinolinate synthase n=2 Tax=Poriferisphaera corsica TaxID=2528020 RepID=A0A517YQA6_9BACT|nr:Quinolinate synthase A [Poriferisphaera corsica]
MLWQAPLPDKYVKMDDDALAVAIAARKAELGDDLVVLGHHYQQDDVVRFADFTGDSFKLSQLAAEAVVERGSKWVIFAGVHFMAESADILTDDDVAVILPDMGAGCSMADMANYEQTVEAWEYLHECVRGENVRIVPMCYMNCTAAIKAFCGEHGGAVCTSSNAEKMLRWALAGSDEPLKDGEQVKILFLPDQHLGRNTGADLGFDVEKEMVVYDPKEPEACGEADVRRSSFILWKGHCSVHKLFRPEHVGQVKEVWPDVTVMVHPECDHAVVKAADCSGSTEAIIKAVTASAAGSRWAIGTEVHLVNRLRDEMKEKGVEVRMLSECQCLCTTMYRIDMPHLLYVMDQLVEGEVVNQVSVPEGVQHWAKVSMERMLRVTTGEAVKV